MNKLNKVQKLAKIMETRFNMIIAKKNSRENLSSIKTINHYQKLTNEFVSILYTNPEFVKTKLSLIGRKISKKWSDFYNNNSICILKELVLAIKYYNEVKEINKIDEGQDKKQEREEKGEELKTNQDCNIDLETNLDVNLETNIECNLEIQVETDHETCILEENEDNKQDEYDKQDEVLYNQQDEDYKENKKEVNMLQNCYKYILDLFMNVYKILNLI